MNLDPEVERLVNLFILFRQADRLHSRIMVHPTLDMAGDRYFRLMHKTLMRTMRRRDAYRLAVYGPDEETDNGD